MSIPLDILLAFVVAALVVVSVFQASWIVLLRMRIDHLVLWHKRDCTDLHRRIQALEAAAPNATLRSAPH